MQYNIFENSFFQRTSTYIYIKTMLNNNNINIKENVIYWKIYNGVECFRMKGTFISLAYANAQGIMQG